MQVTLCLERFKVARYELYRWRCRLAIAHKILLALGFACLTGLLAQARVYLPWTPVPVTGQTFAVFLSAVFLGKWGGVSQAMYVLIGAAGVPWFAGWQGGMGVITGPTGGYIFGFILAAFFVGYLVDRYIRFRSFPWMITMMLIANFALIHGLGLLQLYLWLSLSKGTSVGARKLLMMGVIPFFAGDVLKVLMAAVVGKALTPKETCDSQIGAKG